VVVVPVLLGVQNLLAHTNSIIVAELVQNANSTGLDPWSDSWRKTLVLLSSLLVCSGSWA